MLDLDNSKAQTVASTELGTLVLYAIGSARFVGLCVSPIQQTAAHALILFDCRDGGQPFKALYWPNVEGRGCISLGQPRVAADLSNLLAAEPARHVQPRMLLTLPSGGFGITAQVQGGALRTWNLHSGLLVETPVADFALNGWQIGTVGIDGKFVAVITDSQAAPAARGARNA